MKKLLVSIPTSIIILLISLLFNITLYGQEAKIIKRVMNNSEFKEFKRLVGTYEEGKNYNEIIDGHGTGLMPPTEKQWKEIKNQPILIDKIELPIRKEEVPSSYDNSSTVWFPPIGSQGGEGSCASWSCVYYIKTFQEAREHNWDLSGCKWEIYQPSTAYQDKIFSPDFIFHIGNSGVDGAMDIWDNMNFLNVIGCCTWDKMPTKQFYDTTWPNENAWRQAPWYRSQTGYSTMSVKTDSGIENLKQLLANGNLASIRVMAGAFGNLTSEDLWTLDNYNLISTNHANTIVGYQDNFGPYTESGDSNTYGAFKVANSWGVGGWENIADGFYYISYECMKQRIKTVWLYQNYINYNPKMVAVFEMNHKYSGENRIDFGIGNPDSPFNLKFYSHGIYLNAGNHPFPDNPIVIDITEFISYMNNINNQFYMQIYDGETPTTGILKSFSVEKYDDYTTAIPTNVYVSKETPFNTKNDTTVYASIYTSNETIVILYPSAGDIIGVGSNPTITYSSVGNSGYVNLDYSTDGGATWDTIATNQLDDGDYKGWIVPNTPSTNCKIRISDVDGSPSVENDGFFTIQWQQFIEQNSISLIGVGEGSAVWGDYDNDGDLDLLLSGGSDNDLVSIIYRNNGDNTFTEQTSISLTGVYGSTPSWGDYDNDGDLDILLAGESIDGYTFKCISKVYRNNGNNTFTEQTSVSLGGINEGSAAWADYDNDGYLDILLSSTIYKNNCDNTFSPQIYFEALNQSSAAWGDYDNDGYLDILLTGHADSGPASNIYHNNGDNTFPGVTFSLPGVFNGSCLWGDYDNDGNLDILLTGFDGDKNISNIYRNNGDNSFTDKFSFSEVLGYAAWGDYNNDGYLDILSSKIYHNNGDNTFTAQTTFSLSDIFHNSVSWGDYDNDGDLDIVITGYIYVTSSQLSPVTKIYSNNGTVSNTLPLIPSNLQEEVNGSNVTFSWDKSTDNETPQNGLTYNVSIGTSPGSCDILSPMADINTGKRRIVDIGNAGHCNFKIIKGLHDGKYYWSVQAIDNNFAGSQFAEEKSFIIQSTETIVITYPKGGEIFEAGSNPTITYSSLGNSGYVNLYYSTDGGSTWDTIVTNQLDDGYYEGWIVPNTPSTNCKIRITDVDGEPSALSDSLFIITGVVPVELISFTGNSNKNKIMLNWKTATETNNKGFEIQRKLSTGWEKAGYMNGSGTTTNPKEYFFTDNFEYKSYKGIVSYRLKQIDYSGSSRYSEEIKLDVDFTPKEYVLYQNYPNPFNPSTTIKYALPFESRVEIIIYNMLGQKIKEFDEGVKAAGYYDLNWQPGNLSSGIYFYFVHADGKDGKNQFSKTLKMLFMK